MKMNWIREKFSNLSILLGLLLVLIAFVLLGFGLRIFGISSDALLSLISAIIGGLIATSSQAWVSAQDRQNQLRLAALDKRLQAHQEAYSRWRKLLFNAANENTIGDIVIESQTWWEENCLYLDPKTRKLFYSAVQRAGQHLTYIRSRDISLIQGNMKSIEETGEAILAGVSLPTIGEDENKSIEIGKSEKETKSRRKH
jgi:hypothetical protein